MFCVMGTVGALDQGHYSDHLRQSIKMSSVTSSLHVSVSAHLAELGIEL